MGKGSCPRYKAIKYPEDALKATCAAVKVEI